MPFSLRLSFFANKDVPELLFVTAPYSWHAFFIWLYQLSIHTYANSKLSYMVRAVVK